MKWFGESWGAPVCDEGEQVEVPLDWLCERCGVEFGEGDQGVVLVCYEKEETRDYPLHLFCLLDSVGP
jgi:hypothetical protein